MTGRVRRSEAGTTLVEVLITVMVVGVAFVAFLGGMGTSILSSGLHRRQAESEPIIRRYAEFVKALPYDDTCPASYATPAFADVPPGFTLTAPTVAFVDPVSGAATCSDRATHVVTVAVASGDGQVTESLELVKRPGS